MRKRVLVFTTVIIKKGEKPPADAWFRQTTLWTPQKDILLNLPDRIRGWKETFRTKAAWQKKHVAARNLEGPGVAVVCAEGMDTKRFGEFAP